MKNIKFRVQTEGWTYKECTNVESALVEFEIVKDRISDGVMEDSFIELVVSNDNFEDYKVLRKVVAVVDEEKMAISSPVEEGYKWDYWAKWQEVNIEDGAK